jgi:hypothetical protein
MRTIEAIQTEYRGRWFRSRLEARWAVLFDLIGLPWEYELRGMDIHGIRYLPDFVLPTVPGLVEVKPANIPRAESQRLAAVVAAVFDAGLRLFVVRGVPDESEHRVTCAGSDGHYAFRRCRRCAGVTLVTEQGESMDIGDHDCGEHERPGLYDYQSEFRTAKRWMFDHAAK